MGYVMMVSRRDDGFWPFTLHQTARHVTQGIVTMTGGQWIDENMVAGRGGCGSSGVSSVMKFGDKVGSRHTLSPDAAKGWSLDCRQHPVSTWDCCWSSSL